MALPSSGAISFSDINTEIGRSSTAQTSLNDTLVRTVFGQASGAVDMNTGHGKAYQFLFTISANQTNANLSTLATAAGWDGVAQVIATVATGVYISSNSTATPALTVNGTFSKGVQLINNGYIVGMGGAAGGGKNYDTALPGSGGGAGAAGGTALSVSTAISIDNTSGTIGGGGGGGGGGGNVVGISSGGGGGGGRTGVAVNSSAGAAGSNAPSQSRQAQAGSAGTSSAGGAGGVGGQPPDTKYYGGTGGTGGDWGSAGGTGGTGVDEFGHLEPSGYAGGAAGAAVVGNSNITWIATGTRMGSVS